MKKIGKIYIFIIFVFILNGISLSAQVQVFAKLSDEKIGIGEPFTLIITIEGGSGRVNIPDIDGLTMRGNSQSRNMVLSGGTFKSSQIFYYTFVANDAGIYSIDGIDIKVKGQTYRVGKVRIEVLDTSVRGPKTKYFSSDEESSNFVDSITADDVYVKNVINKKEVYMYEPIYIYQTAYTRVPVKVLGISDIPNRNDFISFSDFEDYSSTREIINGQTFSVKPLKREVLYPIKAGDKIIETTSYVFQNSGTIFYDQIERGRDKYKIKVIPLPSDGRNTNFSGAVGEFDFSLSSSKTNVSVGEDFILKLEVKGEGNTSIINMPDIDGELSNYFTVYPEKIYETNWFDGNNIVGIKTKEYLLIANKPGVFNVPSVYFSYFSPDQKSYESISSLGLSIEVFGGGNRILHTNTNISEVEIIPIKTILIKEGKTFNFLDNRYIYIYVISILVLTVIVVLVRKIKSYRNKNYSNEVENDGFNYVRECYNKGSRGDYCREAETVFLTSIASILSVEKSTSMENILKFLKDRNVEDNIIKNVKSLVDLCRFEEYSGENLKENTDYHTDMIKIIKKLREELK